MNKAFHRHITATAIGLTIAATAWAQRPIVQTNFTPDPAPMVYNDTFYIYTGHDEDGRHDEFVMNEWRVYSSKDMVNWTDHGSPMSLDTFSWAEWGAWASQCIERNGRFYWYVCCVDSRTHDMAIGVAVADSPTGPFTDAIGAPLVSDPGGYIDPTVFIEPDGNAWLYWGNPGLWCCKLNPDMISYDKNFTISGNHVEKVKDGVYKFIQTEDSFGGPEKLAEGTVFTDYKDLYEEGPWFYKRNGSYILAYAAGGVPEHISYSVSDSPWGPWKYAGQIMPLQEMGSFTNHCGIADFKGRHYFAYHCGTLPGGSGFNRSTAIEQFEYNPDGSLPIILPTTKGPDPVGTLNPYSRVEAETIA
ncbi:glycoside hydrolase family 43 protein, partial [Duncaniella muris]